MPIEPVMVLRTQMCTVDDVIGGDPCPRLAQWIWLPADDQHPVCLCNFHAEPFEATWQS